MAEVAAPPAWQSALDALRERGAQARDPHRFRFAEALARRAAAHEGAARRVIDAKLATLVSALGEGVGPPSVEAASLPARTPRRPLADLLEHIARREPLVAPQDRLQTLDLVRRTWARLSAEQRIAQSRSALPANAGPLHSQHVVHRSLTRMRALSPAYFERFVAHVDALLWLEQTNGTEPADAAPVGRGRPGRTKASRSR